MSIHDERGCRCFDMDVQYTLDTINGFSMKIIEIGVHTSLLNLMVALYPATVESSTASKTQILHCDC